MEGKEVVEVKRSYLSFLFNLSFFFLIHGAVNGLKKIAFGDTALCVAFTRSSELFRGGR